MTTKYEIMSSAEYRRGLKRVKKRGWPSELLKDIICRLANGETLTDFPWRDHPLKGEWREYHECHVLDDWVLIYQIDKTEKILYLAQTGNHDELGIDKPRRH